MRTIRVYCPGPLAAGAELTLAPEAGHHLARVLRVRPGMALVLFDGAGAEHPAQVLGVTAAQVQVAVEPGGTVDRESPLAVTVGLGISRGERMDYAVQKAVELGVARIVPLLTERCVVRLDGQRTLQRLEHWRRVVVGACEQCGRNRLPPVDPVATLEQWLASGPAGVVLDAQAATALGASGPADGRLILLVGPEGGLSRRELDAARRAGLVPVRLGPRVLRTETAVVAALAAIQTLWGDLARTGGQDPPP